MKKHPSYKQFANLNGVTVFDRLKIFIQDIADKEDTQTLADTASAIRIMEQAYVIPKDEADALVDLIMVISGVKVIDKTEAPGA